MAASAVFAQQSTFAGQDGVISQLVDGAGWKTSISLNNIDATPGQYKLSFFSDSGLPLSLQTNFGTGTFVFGTTPARGSVTMETAGTKVALSQGWALMETIFLVPGSSSTITPGATIGGTVLYVRPSTVSGPTEASEPLDFWLESQWALPFDHLNGYSSGVALVNQLTFSDLSVFVRFSTKVEIRLRWILSPCPSVSMSPSPSHRNIPKPLGAAEPS